jgi:hypothetical protein
MSHYNGRITRRRVPIAKVELFEVGWILQTSRISDLLAWSMSASFDRKAGSTSMAGTFRQFRSQECEFVRQA